MIVIKTANGNRFINENEVKSVSNIRSATIVRIIYKDGTVDIAYQVENVLYTNKADTEISDNGMAFGAIVKDREFWKQEANAAKDFIEKLYDERSGLESFIINHGTTPKAGSYEERFIANLKEKLSHRPGSIMKEFENFKEICYPWERARKEQNMKGDEASKAFVQMNKEIEEKSKLIERYTDANIRLMKRNLWERIINKRVFL